MGPDPPWLLVEMLREAERVSDRILRMAEEQDDKTEQTIAMGVATLGGGLALISMALQAAGLESTSLAILACAVVSNLVALWRFVGAYLGLSGRKGLALAPGPQWLLQRARDAEWTADAHLLQVLTTHAADALTNLAALTSVAERRASGMRVLFVAWVLYAIGAFYAVAGSLMR